MQQRNLNGYSPPATSQRRAGAQHSGKSRIPGPGTSRQHSKPALHKQASRAAPARHFIRSADGAASPQRRRTGPSADRIGSRQNCLKQSRIGQNRPAVLLSQPRQGEPSAEQRRQAQIEQAASHAGKPAKSAGLMLLTYMYSFTFLKAKSLPVHVTSHSHNHPAGGPNPGQTFSIRPHAPVQAEPIVSDLSREEAGTPAAELGWGPATA